MATAVSTYFSYASAKAEAGWLQGKSGVSGNTTRLMSQIKFSEKIQNFDFQAWKAAYEPFHKVSTLTISQVALDEIPGFGYRRTALVVAGWRRRKSR